MRVFVLWSNFEFVNNYCQNCNLCQLQCQPTAGTHSTAKSPRLRPDGWCSCPSYYIMKRKVNKE